MSAEKKSHGEGRWQIAVGVLVALGCLVTVAYAVGETFWG
jgi:hypothetical protein